MAYFSRVSYLALALLISPLSFVWADTDTSPETYLLLGKFSEAFRLIRENSFPAVTDKELVDAAIQGMLKYVDTHNAYLPEDALDDVHTGLQEALHGIGIFLTEHLEGPEITDIVPGSPAELVGLQKGDLLLAIAGEPVANMPLRDIGHILSARMPQKVTLTIKRGNRVPSTFQIEKKWLPVRNSQIELRDDLLYITLPSLNQHAVGAHLRQEIIHLLLKKPLSTIKGVILDLRNNYGGLVEEAIATACLFLQDETITKMQGQNATSTQLYSAINSPVLPQIPMVALINKSTASAAEILAAALQDHKRAILIGEPTYGKASVQSILPLSHAAGAVKLTTHHYFTPKGYNINKRGLDPDIHLSPPPPPSSGDPFIHAAKEYILSMKT